VSTAEPKYLRFISISASRFLCAWMLSRFRVCSSFTTAFTPREGETIPGSTQLVQIKCLGAAYKVYASKSATTDYTMSCHGSASAARSSPPATPQDLILGHK
jgi:hypothetical protein